MLDWAVRYIPILRALQGKLAPGEMILEVGSGPHGLGTFSPHPYVGCDVKFDLPPRKPMLPVKCSAVRLPFRDGSFAAVVASDVLEHVPPEFRAEVVKESLRVAERIVIFGFPFGPRAHRSDERFHSDLKRRHVATPDWLKEHLLYPFPGPELFENLGDAWTVQFFGNEYLGFHEWVTKRAFSRFWIHFFKILVKGMQRPLEFLVKLADREPFYRRVFVVTRRSPGGVEAS